MLGVKGLGFGEARIAGGRRFCAFFGFLYIGH